MNPLVSIILITYNSSKYVFETLESIKNQTYSNIELIISDDCSSDNTVSICENWIANNQSEFVRVKILTVSKNTGIPSNCNRGIKEAKGEWIKLIAGDDLFFPNAIEQLVSNITKNDFIQIAAANYIRFNNIEEEKMMLQSFFFKATTNEQFQYLLRYNRIPAPAVFLKKQLIEKVGGFDESFPLIEDYPMWIKISKAGVKIHSFDFFSVKYRLHDVSVSSMQAIENKTLIPRIFMLSQQVRMKYCLKYLPFIEKIDLYFQIYQTKLFVYFFKNRNSSINRKLYFYSKILNPFVVYRKILLASGRVYKHIKYVN